MEKIGKYQLVKKLATGGMAEVYLAKFEWARGLEKTVVVKRILSHLTEDPRFIEMFFSEAQLAAQLSHPNIAQIIEFGESEGACFLAMEYVDGPSLRGLEAVVHADGGRIPYPYSARIASFCCEALTHAHELKDADTGEALNLVHRDVSPDNILLTRSGSVKLVDFGIAKAATQSHHTQTGLVKGKISYMPPEQVRAEPLDCRADVFALGVVLYEMVAGTKPYDAPSEALLIHAILYEEMVPLRTRQADVPPELERIVHKALERDRERRYANCREMHAALEEYLIATRQPVTALQLAQFVEKCRLTIGKGEGTPPPGKVTPGPRIPAATPAPWRAERTPAHGAAVQAQQQVLRTGTYGGPEGVAVAPPAEAEGPASLRLVDKTEMVAPSGPSPSRPSPPAHRSEERSEPRARSRKPLILAAVGALALLVTAIAFIRWPLVAPPRPVDGPQEKNVATAPVPKAAVAETSVGAGTSPPPETKQQPGEVTTEPWTPPVEKPPETKPPEQKVASTSPAKNAGAATKPLTVNRPPVKHGLPPKPDTVVMNTAKSGPTIELEVHSEPSGTIKVFSGDNKVIGMGSSPYTIHVPLGSVVVEAAGHGEHSFLKRETISLDASLAHQEHTISASQGAVMFLSSPASSVSVDGILKGDVPLKVVLYEGPHAVHFECDRRTGKCGSGMEAEKTVVVQPGRTIDFRQVW